MSRSELRELVLSFLYQVSIQKEDVPEQMHYFLQEHELQSEDLEFFQEFFEGVRCREDELDEQISRYLIDWRLERLPILDRCILRMASYELKYHSEVPASVSISEAVNLAKRYCDDEAYSYINAVLAQIHRHEDADADG